MASTTAPQMAQQSPDYQHLTVRRLCGALGAEVGGVDLATALSPAVAEEIRRAFLDHGLLAFRDQDLSPERQIAFTEIFGPVEQHPLYRSAQIAGFPEILVLEHKAGQHFNGRNDVWHADITFHETPPLGSVLHCRAAWEGFADTLFANQALAYGALSAPRRDFLEGLEAEHSAAELQRRNNRDSYNKGIEAIPTPVIHPAVRTHPETGRKALFVNPVYTTRLCGLTPEESANILAFLHDHAVSPPFVYRHRWRVGDVVMFDNRCLLHYVVPDHPVEMHRRMHRTTARGERPT